ncbi:phosphonate C-P lyase system protein PhnH [Aquamicrobium sp. LC103]|uniref:phosphonate C-P lyase system protein PhnH n=1 Tax=Aquamicrobium sp. LC103 TaxID=1120658 RepID=UPI00063EB838|nr:phosphonate C-P lyase system protein PhnH [Aquamicrobium sp. LC103]TKT74649.1 phosphonate C-P lyase system protein PhnH [Aquamicrobium sp. LC103]
MTHSEAVATEGGFADPVFDSQAVFAAIMDAFARPGKIVDLGARATAPAPMPAAAAAFIATLADFDTPIWLDEGLGQVPGLVPWISFHTGAPLAGKPDAARFAVLSDARELLDLGRFALGTPEYPDRSATIIAVLEGLDGGERLVLSGPGIEHEAFMEPRGLPSGFLAAVARNNALFPLGVDILLVAGAKALALARTTRIRSA